MESDKRSWSDDNLTITKKMVVPTEDLDKRVLELSLSPHPFWVDAYILKMCRRKKTNDIAVLLEQHFLF